MIFKLDLIHYWPFNNTPNDYINGNDLILPSGIRYSADRYGNKGNALDFFSQNIATYFPTGYYIEDSFSIMFWILLKDINENQYILNFDSEDKFQLVKIYYDLKYQNLFVKIGSNTYDSGSTKLLYNEWYHIVVTANSQESTIYIDCIKANTCKIF